MGRRECATLTACWLENREANYLDYQEQKVKEPKNINRLVSGIHVAVGERKINEYCNRV